MNRLIITLLFSIFSAISVMGQITVVGHVSAEIIESVSIQNNVHSYINIDPNESSVKLGSLNLSGMNQQAYEVSLSDAIIYNANTEYQIPTALHNASTTKGSTGEISLSASINENLANGNYDGRITVIVAYN